MIDKFEVVFNSLSIHLIIVSFSMMAMLPLIYPISKWIFKDMADDKNKIGHLENKKIKKKVKIDSLNEEALYLKINKFN